MDPHLQLAISHISLTLASLVLDVILCIIIQADGTRKEQRNKKYLAFCYVMLIGMVLTCLDEALRRDGLVDMPQRVGMALHLSTFLANTLLCYYFSRYTETFFKERSKFWRRLSDVNAVLMICSIVLNVGCYIRKFITLDGTPESFNIVPWFRFIIAFAFELYFILYSAVLFVVHRREPDKRAVITAVGAFMLTISCIVLELFNKTGILINYFGAAIGLYVFYIGVETPDYKLLLTALSELEKEKKRADEANDSKSAFLADMSHEIRTPINAVIGMNEMILRECTDRNIIGYAKNIDSSGKTLLSIINDVLDISKIEAGRMELEPGEYSFGTLIHDTVNMILPKAEGKGLIFEWSADESMPDRLYGDEKRIRQILVNLLNNAVKYTEKGYVKLEISYELAGRDIELSIDVSDTGIGIKEEDMGRLFNKFDRLDKERNKSIEGTGLGLPIVISLLKLMNGTIDVDSIYGEGTTFRITIPQKAVGEETVAEFRKRTEENRSRGSGYRALFNAPDARLLVVDDTAVNLVVVKGLLKTTGIGIDTASSGKEALKKCEETAYDLILMDIRMPLMSGTECMHLIKQQENGLNQKTPVICLTADAIAGAREHYLEEGFDSYITKPFKSSDFEAALAQFLPASKVKYTSIGE
jgi:signal transduction histidine kinase/ActR/RegA family two-component response regulator